jgi:hypothetical protein
MIFIIKHLKTMGILLIVITLIRLLDELFAKGLSTYALIDYSISIVAAICMLTFPQEKKERIFSLFEKPKK